MYARVAKFEGAESEGLKETVEQIKQRSESGPPEGVPGKSFFLLTNEEEGNAMGIILFETEADLKQGHETMNEMSPPTDGGMGKRASVELYEVAIQMDA